MSDRMSLDLYAEVTTADGTRHRWDANQPAGSRLKNFSFRTKIGEGFSDAGGQLARRVDIEWADLGLVQTVTFVGADGSVAYEGRLEATPRELDASSSIGVTLAGWMAHAKDQRFAEIYVDRARDGWGGISLARKYTLLTGNWTPYDAEQTIDPSDGKAGLATTFNGSWASPYKPLADAWYDAGPGLTIGRVGYSWRRAPTVTTADTQWQWRVFVSDDDQATNTESTANLRANGPGTLLEFAPTARYRYALVQLLYNATAAGLEGVKFAVDWYKLAVYGDHGLTLHTGDPSEPKGVYGSDVIRDIASRFAPKLDVSGVRDSDYVIQHCAFKERTFPYDAFLEINKYHLRHLEVWEDRRLDWYPYDFSDYDWDVRTDDIGSSFSEQGPSTENVFNGIVVLYEDLLTGTQRMLTPDDHAELRDVSERNPWNVYGITRWDEVTLSTPTLEAQALETGRGILASKNRAKTPGTLTVRGYIRDRVGVWQPAWKVRAGDTITSTSFPDDEPRLVAETDYDDETKTLKIAVDKPFQELDAWNDRINNALMARGLA